MLKRSILLTAMISASAFATDPFSNNNFTLKSDKIREADWVVENDGQNVTLKGNTVTLNITTNSPNTCEDIDFKLLEKNIKEREGTANWPPAANYQSVPYYVSQSKIDDLCVKREPSDRFTWVSLAIRTK